MVCLRHTTTLEDRPAETWKSKDHFMNCLPHVVLWQAKNTPPLVLRQFADQNPRSVA